MILLENKRAYFDYEILKKFEAGIQLYGFEVKSLKMKRGSLSGSHIIIHQGECYLIGMQIPPFQPSNTPKNYDPVRSRKLLLKKEEIKYLIGKIRQKGLTLVPLSVYTKNRKNLIKISFALARGLKKYDKREIIKEREAKREIERKLKKRFWLRG